MLPSTHLSSPACFSPAWPPSPPGGFPFSAIADDGDSFPWCWDDPRSVWPTEPQALPGLADLPAFAGVDDRAVGAHAADRFGFAPPSDIPRPVALHGGIPDGLVCLNVAMCNLLQDAAYCKPIGGLYGRCADIAEVLRASTHRLQRCRPTGAPRSRFTPDGRRWQLLSLEAAQFAAVGPALFASLDAAVLPQGDQNFVALRRAGARLYCMDGIEPHARALDAAAALRLFGAFKGWFRAAVPAAACHGLVGRLVSYRGIAGFSAACETMGLLLVTDNPLDAFSAWLDSRIDLPRPRDHDDCHRRRRRAYRAISQVEAQDFLRSRGSWP